MNNVSRPLEFNEINDIVLQDEFVGYFDFAVCFSELLDLGQIDEVDENGVLFYKISEIGRETIASYESSLLPVIRERALDSTLKYTARSQKNSNVSATVTEDGNAFRLDCKIADGGVEVFSISMRIAERERAEQYKKNFEERSEIVFKGALSLLSGDVNFIFDE
jgi:hypothetical protein